MGIVYEARDRESGQSVALKTLLNATPASLYMFKQEFRTLADVDHPNLVRLYEFVMSDSDRVFFTMELVRGTDFLSYVRGSVPQGEPPPDVTEKSAERIVKGDGSAAPEPRRALDAPRREAGNPTRKGSRADFDRIRSPLIQLIEGVMALHAARKLHRDIKPSNVLVTPEGRVVLLDFGVATELSRVVNDEMREENEVVGTATYMAPEQPFEEPTPACDWYSVGVMLYEAIVGNPPFAGSVTDVLETKNRIDARPPSEFVEDVPADLDALCCALLRREPTTRPTGPEILQRLGLVAGQRAEPTSSGVMPVADAAAGESTLPVARCICGCCATRSIRAAREAW